MSVLREKIRSRGFMDVTIRPVTFVKARVPNVLKLVDLLRSRAVQGRGWDFPHVGQKIPPVFDDYVESETEFHDVLEVWRFYQSGLFNHLSGFRDDWRDQSSLWPANENWRPNATLGVENTVGRVAEVFLLASRLALSDAGDAKMHVALKFGGIKSRRLEIDTGARLGFTSPKEANVSEFAHEVEMTRDQLVADSNAFAETAIIELFRRFNWDAPVDTIREMRAVFRLK